MSNVNTGTSSKKIAFLTLAIAFLISCIEGADIQAAGIAGAGIGEHFGLDKAQLGYFFSAGIFGLLPGGILGGYYADRIGRKKVLAIAVAVFAVFTLTTIWMPSLTGLVIVRFLAGVGMGAALPNLVALAAEAVSQESRGRAVGFIYAGMPFGAALLSLVARGDFGANWHNIFILGAVLPLFALPLIIWVLPESRSFLARKNNPTPAVEAAQDNSFKVVMSKEHFAKTVAIGISFFFTTMVIYIMISWLPLLFKDLGFSRPQGATAQFYYMILGTVGAILMSFLLDKLNKAFVIIMVYVGIVVGLFMLSSASGISQMNVAAMVTGLFVIGSQSLIYAASGMLYPTEIRATAVGIVAGIGRVGAILGPLVAGWILATGSGAIAVITACIPGIIIGAVTLLYGFMRGKHYLPKK